MRFVVESGRVLLDRKWVVVYDRRWWQKAREGRSVGWPDPVVV
jgi:hypothetical protein